MDVYGDVCEFHEALDVPMPSVVGFPSDARLKMRLALVAEETDELCRAAHARDMVGVADGIVDLVYCAVGMAVELGIPLPEVWAEVHRANLAKRGGPLRADGKCLKPPGWQAPDVAGVLERAGWNGWR